VDEAEQLARDRKRYHLHAITFVIGLLGWSGIGVLSAIIEPGPLTWLMVAFSAVLVASGVFAIAVKRTVLSKRANDSDDDDPGDALVTPGIWSGDLWPSFSNAVAPYAVLLVGLALLGFSLIWALRALR
jgi:protein-S-isoprenylcysteine O-methyltransferase Ste14